MAKKYKKAKFGFFGLKVQIKISYSPKYSLPTLPVININKNLLFSMLLIIIVLAGSIPLKEKLIIPVYATENTKLLSDISPLSQISENNIPRPVSKNDDVVFHGPTDKKKIALTFDADMTPRMKNNLTRGRIQSYYDHRTIEILKNTNTKATLFLSGMWIESYPTETSFLAGDSLFELANHSYSHPSFDGHCYGLTPSKDDQDKEEINKTQKLLSEYGKSGNKYFRFPGGCYSKTDLENVKKEGLKVVHWDVAGQDGFNGDRGLIEKNILDNVKNGSIIVLHMNGFPNEPETANALPKIIGALKEKGYEFVKVSELLGADKIVTMSVRDSIDSEYGL